MYPSPLSASTSALAFFAEGSGFGLKTEPSRPQKDEGAPPPPRPVYSHHTGPRRPLMHADSPVLTARARGPARWESSAIRFLTENKRTDALYSYHRFDTRASSTEAFLMKCRGSTNSSFSFLMSRVGILTLAAAVALIGIW